MRPSVTPDIALVNMPYAQLATPSVALGILKTCLTQEGLGASVLNAQLLFAERIGPGLYSFLIRGFPCLVGEWTFSNAAFPEFAPDNDKYVARVARMLAREEPPAVVIEQLWETRAKAEQFVDELAAQILEASPRIVACTSVFQQHCAALALLRRVKELDPAVIALIGGSNCESEMGRTALLNFPWLDVVVSGEADSLFAPLCQDLLAHGPGLPIEKLAEGVFAHQHRTRWSAGEELPVTRHVLNDMRGSPTPDYDDYYSNLETSPLNRAVSPGLPIETSRGCWWGQRKHCTFCGIEDRSMQFRSKPADRVLEEMEDLFGRYGIPRFKVVDLILEMSFFKDLLPQLAASENNFTLFYEVKANLSRERVRLLRDAGITWIQPGIESLHDEALKLVHKGSTAAINLQTLKWAREDGIYVVWSILTEIPGEDHVWFGEMAELIECVVHLQPPMGWNFTAFHRFSPYHSRQQEFGLELAASWMHYFVYPLDVAAMQGLAYRFQDVSTAGLAPGTPPPVPGVDNQSGAPPETLALLNAILRWRELFWSGLPPIMALTDRGDHCEIFDTRPCALAQRVTLTGIEHVIYRFCDEARSQTKIASELAVRGLSADSLDAILADLVRRALMLKVSGRYFALATEGDVPRLPRRGYPGGEVSRQYDQEILAAHEGRKRQSADCAPPSLVDAR